MRLRCPGGTGKSFLPMLPRGCEVNGCDISLAMLALAGEKAGDAVELSVADMRELPRLGEFDLIWGARRRVQLPAEYGRAGRRAVAPLDLGEIYPRSLLLTLAGGSAALVEAIVESPNLEAWRAQPIDSLAFDGDKINQAPDR